MRKNVPSHKYNLKHEKDDYTANINKSFWDDIVNRNRLFYCTHMNRKNAFFQKHVLNSKLPEDEIVARIYKEMFGFARIRKSVKDQVTKMLQCVVRKQKKFDYNYYLTKNCPMPPNWKERKQELIKNASLGGEHRAKVYKFLNDESTSAVNNVADFLTEWVAQVFPKDFVEGKNKKVFNKKVL